MKDMGHATAASRGETFRDGTVVGNRCIVRGRLGGGGMGEVYLVESTNVKGRMFAMKVLLPRYAGDRHRVEMLREEAQNQAALEHDNVVSLIDSFQAGDQYCLLQNYVKGKTLQRMLEEMPQGLPLEQVLTLMTGILRGVDAAHQAGLLHCDIKPANVIVDLEGRPRVTDFGVAQKLGMRTRGGAGTWAYMSPEQFGHAGIDHRSDVFSCGVLMFEMLTGMLPFGDGHELPPRAPALQQTMDAPDARDFRREIPEPVARIIATALQRDPQARFGGCGDFLAAIAAYRARERWKRTWLPAIVAGTVLAAIGGTVLYEWRQHVDDQVKEQEAKNIARARALAEAKQLSVQQDVRNASAALDLMCQKVVDYDIKKVGLTATAGDAELDRQFRAKLDSLQAQITKQAKDYGEAVGLMSRETQAQVSTAVERVAAGDAVVKSFAPSIEADVATLRAGTPLPAVEAMARRCPAALRPSR